MSRVVPVLRVAAGAAVLVLVVQRVGSDAFVHGVHATRGSTLVLAALVTAATTIACAWRWRLVADRLGLDLGLGPAVAAYYRSQALNAVLPGGVVGDAHRAVRHGAGQRALGRGIRAVLWERTAGQVVQVLLALVAVLASPWRPHLDRSVALVAGALGLILLAARALGRSGALDGTLDGALDGALARARREAGAVLGAGGAVRLGASSLLVVAGHVAVFLAAARAVDVTASPARLVPIALLVLVVAALPTNLAGWGPREGAAAWAFAAAGLPAAQGLAASVVYGVVSTVAVSPGLVLLLIERHRPRTPIAPTTSTSTQRRPVREVARA
jgi:uncharacterized membrane protein YbhN (UPF0104 family)